LEVSSHELSKFFRSRVGKDRRRLADAKKRPTVPEEIRVLLGPSWIVEGEDVQLYEDLLAAVGAAVKPMDLIDWLLLKDFVDLTWEIQRNRRNRESLMRLGRVAAMKSILASIMQDSEMPFDLGKSDEPTVLALNWFSGEKEAIKRVEDLLAQTGLSQSDVTAQTLAANAAEFARLDARDELYQSRRNSLLKQIERRRAGWAKQMRRASETVIDADFEQSPPERLPRQTEDEVTAGRR
jgi:hypothetical protein